jgi:hypothetical protein
MTPDERLLDFLQRLPATIKETVIFQCCFGMDITDLVTLSKENQIDELREVLDLPGRSRAYVCAQAIGVLELVLEPDEVNLEKPNQALYQETGVETFRDIALRQPFARRHWQAARKQFRKLRQGDLSPQALRRWQLLLSVPSPPEPDRE